MISHCTRWPGVCWQCDSNSLFSFHTVSNTVFCPRYKSATAKGERERERDCMSPILRTHIAFSVFVLRPYSRFCMRVCVCVWVIECMYSCSFVSQETSVAILENFNFIPYKGATEHLVDLYQTKTEESTTTTRKPNKKKTFRSRKK